MARKTHIDRFVVTCEVYLPTSGVRMDTRSLDSSYDGEFRKDTIGRRGISGLCILGNLYKRGIFPAELYSRLYRVVGIPPSCVRERSRAIIFLSFPVLVLGLGAGSCMCLHQSIES